MGKANKTINQIDTKMVEYPLVRSLNEVWYEHAKFNQRSLCFGEYYGVRTGLDNIGLNLFIQNLIDNQVYFSTLVLSDLQIEFESIGPKHVNSFESVVYLILQSEVMVNFHYNMLVHGLIKCVDNDKTNGF